MSREGQFDVPPPYRYIALLSGLLAAAIAFAAGFAVFITLIETLNGPQSVQSYANKFAVLFLRLLPTGGIAAIIGLIPALFIGRHMVAHQKFGLRHFLLAGITAGLPPIFLLGIIAPGLMFGMYLPVTIFAGIVGGWAARLYLLNTKQIPK